MGDGNKVGVHVEALPDKDRSFTWKDGRKVYNSMGNAKKWRQYAAYIYCPSGLYHLLFFGFCSL